MIESIFQSITLLVVIYFLWRFQEKYFEVLERRFEKSSNILEKTNKELLLTIAKIFKKEKPVYVEEKESENTIEKESEADEVNLVDMPRIPIVPGVKIKFEDEESSQPVDIFPYATEQDKNENPIEK